LQTQLVVFFKKMWEQDTRCWEECGRRGFASSYYGETLQAPLFPSPGFIPGPQQGTMEVKGTVVGGPTPPIRNETHCLRITAEIRY
jgi:hypothetical protein